MEEGTLKEAPALGTGIAEVVSKYSVHALCSDCSEKLNETIEMTREELRKEWGSLVVASPIQSGRCPNGCPSSLSSLNFTKLEIYDIKSKKYVPKEEVSSLLRG